MTIETVGPQRKITFEEVGPASRAARSDEVVLAISPAFAEFFSKTIIDIAHADVIRQILAGIEEQGVSVRVVRIRHSADLALIAHTAAKLSGSGIGIGILSRGTTMIHQRDLPRLSSLELFPQSPMMTLETYRSVGRNAAQYAKGESPAPIPTSNDPMARPRFQAKAALLHLKETEHIDRGVRPIEVRQKISSVTSS